MKSGLTEYIMSGTLALILSVTGTLYAAPGPDGDAPGKRGPGGPPWMLDGAGEQRGGEHRGPHDRPTREEILEKFDANEDGKLDQEEKAAMKAARKERFAKHRAKMLEKFDADGDGKLNEEERAAAHEAHPRLKGRKLPKHVVEKFDKDGDGKLNETEREAARAAHKEGRKGHRQKMLKKFDADGDGELNAEEKKAMREFMKEHGPRRGPPGEAGPRRGGPDQDEGPVI